MLWKRSSLDDLTVEQIAAARPVQQQFWLLQQMLPDVGVANIAARLSWYGPLDLLILQEALLDLVCRHSYLRTTVEYTDAGLEQITHAPRAIPIELVDLRSASDNGTATQTRCPAVEAELAKAAERPLAADQIPWIRATAVRAGDTQFEIALVVSHLICDGLSMGVLCAELMQAYAARLDGSVPQWSNTSVVDLNPATGIEVHAPDRETPLLDLPYDFPPPAAPSYRGGRLNLALSAAQSKALITLSRNQQVSPFVTWLSLLHAVAYRYSRRESLEIEIPMSGRDRSLRRAVGPLLQSATLCLSATDETTFAQLLADNATALDIASESITHTAARRAQLLLDYQSALDEVPLNDRITVMPGELSNGASIAELRVGVRRRRRHFEIQIDFDTDLFSEATAMRFGGHLQQVLQEVAEEPNLRLADLILLTPEERHLIQCVNQTHCPYDAAQLVDGMFDAQVQRSVDAVAMVHNHEQLTYRQLGDRATELAYRLTSHGVRHGDRVALLLDRGIDAVAAMLAILKCGAAFVPIDPEYPEHRQALVLQRAEVKCVVTTERYAERIPNDFGQLRIDIAAAGVGADVRQELPPLADRQSDDIAYVLFTSGSTGEPKGVQVTHRNLGNFFVGMDALQSDDSPGCWLALTSMSFDISIYELLWTLIRGYQVVIEDDPLGLSRGDSEALARRMRQHRVTHMQCTPALMQALLCEPASRAAIAALDKVFVGGDAMPAALAEDLVGLVAGDVYNMYGPTETTIWSTAWKLNGDSRNVSIGKPLANTQVRILDSAAQHVPTGVTGELFIGGDGVAAGYFQDALRTAERFIERPGSGRMFRTGDLVRMRPDGNLQFLGRSDQQIKFNGHRLELGEIETVLHEHAAVQEAVAVLHQSQGETKKIVAFVRTQIDSDRAWAIEQEALFSMLKQRLPSYMIPARIELLDEMPLTPARKVDRQALMSLPLTVTPCDQSIAEGGVSCGLSHDPLAANPTATQITFQQRVRAIVCDELQLDELPSGSNLAELGINSLEVVRLADRVEREFGVRPPIALFFRSLSLEEAITTAVQGTGAHAVEARAGTQTTTRPPSGASGWAESRQPEFTKRRPVDTPKSVASLAQSSPLSLAANLELSSDAASAMDRLAQVSASFRAAFDDESLHPYARYVDPVKSELLARAGLNRTYLRGEGCYLWDQADQRCLDFVAQYGALPFGFNPPEIWDALWQMRADGLPNFATNSLLDSAGKLAERLLKIVPAMRHVVFCNSGAECTEIAIKLCRSATGRMGILSTKQGFHGLTTGAAAVTGSDSFRDGFIADAQNYQHVPFGDIEALRNLLQHRAAEFAALVIEPIQGEAGIIVPPPGYLAEVRRLCTQHQVLLVVDEVQTGLGRTGALLASDHEAVVPDVLLLAKALGGGLVPIGAVLCTSDAYSDRFGLRHSSTFAGNALACQAGMASLDLLEANDQALVRHVAECGQYLHERLQGIRAKYPELVREVRGRGYMQAIEFDFGPLDDRSGLLGFLADQQMLIYLTASHLLHVHHVRVAPSFVGRDVIRIEPALTAGRIECDLFVEALDATLAVIDSGNTAALLAPMAGADPQEMLDIEVAPSETRAISRSSSNQAVDAEFGFLIHLSSLDDLISYDGSLAAFSTQQLKQLKSQLVRSADPFVIGDAIVKSKTGQTIRGHFVMVPYTPSELQAMSPEAALQQVTIAAEVARQAGAELIGLGGFTSIASMGGVALPQDALPPITSGNSFTVAATLIALRDACDRQDLRLARSTVAVVGATGQTGRALAVVLAGQAGHVILVGRAGETAATQSRLRETAAAMVDHLCHTINDEQLSTAGLLADVCDLGSSGREQILERLLADGRIVLASDVDALATADVIVTASSATESFIEPQHLKRNAIIIDSSRPANVSETVRQQRPDVTWVEGGIIGLPGTPQLDVFAGPQADRTFACVAEAMLWALEPSLRTESASVVLDPARIEQLAVLADVHGFRVL